MKSLNHEILQEYSRHVGLSKYIKYVAFWVLHKEIQFVEVKPFSGIKSEQRWENDKLGMILGVLGS